MHAVWAIMTECVELDVVISLVITGDENRSAMATPKYWTTPCGFHVLNLPKWPLASLCRACTALMHGLRALSS